MARKKGPKKLSVSEFSVSAAELIDGMKDMNGPLMITKNGKAAAYLLGAAEYEETFRKLAAFEKITAALDAADRARMEAHANAISEVTKRRRGLKS